MMYRSDAEPSPARRCPTGVRHDSPQSTSNRFPLTSTPDSRPASHKRRIALQLAAAALLDGFAVRGWGQAERPDPAARPIVAFYDALLAAMKEAQRLGFEGRYDKLAPVIRATFDLPAMTRIAVGPDWNAISAEQQAQLIENFSQMTIATYANRFNGYSGERFEVEPTTEVRNTGHLVRTKIVPSKGEPVALNYLMRGSGETWRIVDIYLTGTISELATRRTEFAAILKAGGPGALVDSLRQQADRQRTTGKPEAAKR